MRPVAARLRLLAAPVDALRALPGDHAPGLLNTCAQGAAPALRIPASGRPGYLLGDAARSRSGGALALLLAAAVRGYVLGLSLSQAPPGANSLDVVADNAFDVARFGIV